MSSTEQMGVVKAHEHWGVTVDTFGEQIVRIETEYLSGREISDVDESTIRRAAEHLLAFIGDPYPAALSPDVATTTRDAILEEVEAKLRTYKETVPACSYCGDTTNNNRCRSGGSHDFSSEGVDWPYTDAADFVCALRSSDYYPVRQAARVLLDWLGNCSDDNIISLIAGTAAMNPHGWELSQRIKFEHGFAAALRALAGEEG